jgi:hypothetical protein
MLNLQFADRKTAKTLDIDRQPFCSAPHHVPLSHISNAVLVAPKAIWVESGRVPPMIVAGCRLRMRLGYKHLILSIGRH